MEKGHEVGLETPPQSVSIAVQAESLHFTPFSSRGGQCGGPGPESPPHSPASPNLSHWFQAPIRLRAAEDTSWVALPPSEPLLPHTLSAS